MIFLTATLLHDGGIFVNLNEVNAEAAADDVYNLLGFVLFKVVENVEGEGVKLLLVLFSVCPGELCMSQDRVPETVTGRGGRDTDVMLSIIRYVVEPFVPTQGLVLVGRGGCPLQKGRCGF